MEASRRGLLFTVRFRIFREHRGGHLGRLLRVSGQETQNAALAGLRPVSINNQGQLKNKGTPRTAGHK